MGRGGFRDDLDRAPEVRLGLAEAPLVLEQPAQIEVGRERPRIEREHPAVALLGLIQAPVHLQRVPEVVVGRRQSRVDLDRPAVGPLGFGHPLLGLVEDAEVVEGPDGFRVAFEQLPVAPLGLLEVSSRLEGLGLLEQVGVHHRPRRDLAAGGRILPGRRHPGLTGRRQVVGIRHAADVRHLNSRDRPARRRDRRATGTGPGAPHCDRESS